MWALHFLVLLSSIFSAVAENCAPGPKVNNFNCDCSWKGVWLDVALLIDNSNSMTIFGLNQIKAHLATMVGFMNISDSSRTSHFTVISYSHTPTVVQEINQPQSAALLTKSIVDMSYSGSGDLHLGQAMKVAAEELGKSKRANAKKVVIIYGTALSQQDSAFVTTKQLQEDGTVVITVAFLQENEGPLAKRLGQIASPGMDFTSSDPGLFDELKGALCDVNCYCPFGWVQFHNDTKPLGQCFRYTNLEANWWASKRSCEERGGYLMAHLDNDYLDQVKTYLQKHGQDPNDFYKLHVGLRYDNFYETYLWDGGFGLLSPEFPSAWCPGFPNIAHGRSVLSVMSKNGDGYCWLNENEVKIAGRYICQRRACDAGKYCP
uniref:VWFA domain-containing protein n=1 Tax=Steinernema glaseri TaxID=37863 RepID=A0A1I7YKQ8_9BILA